MSNRSSNKHWTKQGPRVQNRGVASFLDIALGEPRCCVCSVTMVIPSSDMEVLSWEAGTWDLACH